MASVMTSRSDSDGLGGGGVSPTKMRSLTLAGAATVSNSRPTSGISTTASTGTSGAAAGPLMQQQHTLSSNIVSVQTVNSARKPPRALCVNSFVHESALRPTDQRRKPNMKSIMNVEKALLRDLSRQQYLYGGGAPCALSARYHTELPKGVQNMKFVARPGDRRLSNDEGFGDSDDDDDDAEPGRVVSKHRFNIQTLRSWFKDIDMKRTGSISQRELIVALRQHREMQALFCAVQGVDYSSNSAAGKGPEAAANARREEVKRIKRILDEIDTDGSGTMEWDEFVEFFRRSGLFLEYRTRASLNRCSVIEPFVENLEVHDPSTPAFTSEMSHTSEGRPSDTTSGEKMAVKLTSERMSIMDIADDLAELLSTSAN